MSLPQLEMVNGDDIDVMLHHTGGTAKFYERRALDTHELPFGFKLSTIKY